MRVDVCDGSCFSGSCDFVGDTGTTHVTGGFDAFEVASRGIVIKAWGMVSTGVEIAGGGDLCVVASVGIGWRGSGKGLDSGCQGIVCRMYPAGIT